MQKDGQSQRSIFINRVQQLQLSGRIKKGLEHIQQKEEKLSESRCSQRSRRSELSRSRIARSVDFERVTPKAKLLKEIAEKLKSPKSIDMSPHRLTQSQTIDKPPSIVQKPRKKGYRLELLLKQVKRCNQQSTKAVTIIKRQAHGEMWTSAMTPLTTYKQVQNPKRQIKYQQPLVNSQSSSASPNYKLSGMFRQLVGMKQQLRKVKEENMLLARLIQQNEVNSSLKEQPCVLCGCSCKSKGRTSPAQVVFKNKQPLPPRKL